MPVRARAIEDEASATEDIYRRLRSIEDALRNRLLPPGYSFNVVDGDFVITRTGDGATTTLVFT